MLVLSHYLESRYALRLLEHPPSGPATCSRSASRDVAVLTDALTRIDEGECVIDPTIVARLVQRPRDQQPARRADGARARGARPDRRGPLQPGIGEQLFLSPKTVEAHVTQIFLKLGLTDSPVAHRRVLAVLAFLRST